MKRRFFRHIRHVGDKRVFLIGFLMAGCTGDRDPYRRDEDLAKSFQAFHYSRKTAKKDGASTSLGNLEPIVDPDQYLEDHCGSSARLYGSSKLNGEAGFVVEGPEAENLFRMLEEELTEESYKKLHALKTTTFPEKYDVRFCEKDRLYGVIEDGAQWWPLSEKSDITQREDKVELLFDYVRPKMGSGDFPRAFDVKLQRNDDEEEVALISPDSTYNKQVKIALDKVVDGLASGGFGIKICSTKDQRDTYIDMYYDLAKGTIVGKIEGPLNFGSNVSDLPNLVPTRSKSPLRSEGPVKENNVDPGSPRKSPDKKGNPSETSRKSPSLHVNPVAENKNGALPFTPKKESISPSVVFPSLADVPLNDSAYNTPVHSLVNLRMACKGKKVAVVSMSGHLGMNPTYQKDEGNNQAEIDKKIMEAFQPKPSDRTNKTMKDGTKLAANLNQQLRKLKRSAAWIIVMCGTDVAALNEHPLDSNWENFGRSDFDAHLPLEGWRFATSCTVSQKSPTEIDFGTVFLRPFSPEELAIVLGYEDKWGKPGVFLAAKFIRKAQRERESQSTFAILAQGTVRLRPTGSSLYETQWCPREKKPLIQAKFPGFLGFLDIWGYSEGKPTGPLLAASRATSWGTPTELAFLSSH